MSEGKIVPVGELAGTRGRILAVDFGDRRTGLALSDESRFLPRASAR